MDDRVKRCNIVGCGVLCDSTGIGVGVQACENWPALGSYIVVPWWDCAVKPARKIRNNNPLPGNSLVT